MADTLKLFCLVDGESTSHAFPVEISRDEDVGGLKGAIVSGPQAPVFKGIAAKDLILWRISISTTPPNKGKLVYLKKSGSLTSVSSNSVCVQEVESDELDFTKHHNFAIELDPTDEIDVYGDQLSPKKTIHIIV